MNDIAPDPTRPHLSLLIADDHEDAAELLAMLLRDDGHSVEVAHDGKTALDMAQRLRPDVLLLDIRMPVMDGNTVARRVRETLPDARMLMLAVTGQGSAQEKAEARAAGFDRHFTKPVDTNDLRACIAEWGRSMA
ncbi:response regulator [Hydrogenophaga sp.]|uniref:response regulator n=1 Tax=Hydrogenophaga sp. TaxID=1904254 RepID=UPI002728C069|nr:response regulator [Hydrogenophaga sp.]MDO9438111.1 response regulator [Hydrogenophaga sp.]